MKLPNKSVIGAPRIEVQIRDEHACVMESIAKEAAAPSLPPSAWGRASAPEKYPQAR